jgi:RNase P protein component
MPLLTPIDLVIKPRANAYRATFTELAGELERWLSCFTESHAGHNA